MAWVRQYSAPNFADVKKLKALIFFTINPLLYEKRPLCGFDSLFVGLGATYAVHLRLIGKLIVELFSLGAFVRHNSRV